MSNATIEESGSGFAIHGEMNLATVNHLLLASASIQFNRKSVLEIDLGQVRRADSAGLALLVEWLAKAKHSDTNIRFLNMPKQMREIARITELDSLLPACD